MSCLGFSRASFRSSSFSLFSFFVGMYDATPGNYWFGKKWFWYWSGSKPIPKCPPGDLTNLNAGGGSGSFWINQNDDVDPSLLIQCL